MNQEKPQVASGRQVLTGQERRRSQRVMIRIAVNLHCTVQDKPVVLNLFTSNVNCHGAMLICPQTFAAGTKLVIEHRGTREQQPCHVVRTPQGSAEGFQVPIEFEEPAPDFWKISFPPPDWKPLES
jgi:hypothetical protein